MSNLAFHQQPAERLIDVTLDPVSIVRSANPRVERERQIAIYDLLDENFFALVDQHAGPYRLVLGNLNSRLVFHVHNESSQPLASHALPLAPLKRIMRDYFNLCASYDDAIRSAPPSHLQMLDNGRRKLHDEGGRTLAERLAAKIKVDHNTGRRLFTLICSLQWRG